MRHVDQFEVPSDSVEIEEVTTGKLRERIKRVPGQSRVHVDDLHAYLECQREPKLR
ncbi:hypothetical protein D3C78_1173650 [compost metagenome]